MALKNLILMTMKNHIYSFKNEFYQQIKGGSTGLDETGEVADLYMLWWDLEFLSKIKDLDLKTDIYARFKDDCNVLTDELPLEIEFDKNEHKMIRKITADKISPEYHTAKVLTDIANSIDEMISFSFDVPSNHSDLYLPVLDVKVKLDCQAKVQYQFYEKPTKNGCVILADSALNWQQKRTILTQEALRRLKNTSVELGQSVGKSHLTNFMLKMKDSGYNERFREEIAASALKAFEMIIENDKKGIKPLHRNREQMLIDKRAKSSSGKNWWKKGKISYNTVLYIPATPNSTLAKMIKKRERELNSNSNLRIKILEKGGTKFKNKIVKKNPFQPKTCGYRVCPMCKETDFTIFDPKNVPKCQVGNVGYRFICTNCDGTYEGETARLSRDRVVEHLNDIKRNNKSSPMVKHIELHHKNDETKPKFKIQITGTFNDALSRQADESIRINNVKQTDKRMNSRSEFNSAPQSRVQLVKD